MGKAGAPEGVGYRNIDVTHFTKFYNINQLPRYAIIPPMSYGVLNNNMMGVVRLDRGYVIYITGENLTILLYTFILVLSSHLRNKVKNFKTLDKLYKYYYNKDMATNYLAETKDRQLTEKQEAFLGHLVETGGDFKKSAELAGYSGNHYQVLQSLKEEVVDLASNVLAREAPKAAFKIIEVMKSDKPIPQANYKLQAAQTILDRVGVAKTDRLEVNHNAGGGIFILPEKKAIDIVAEDGDYEDISD